jgi:hypothetical protein
MDNAQKLPVSHRPGRGGSGKRQRQRIANFRVTAEEYATVEGAAKAAGLTLGSYIRGALLEAPTTRMRRRPRADVAALSKLIAELNRIGGNINQLARSANYGNPPEDALLQDTLARLLDLMKGARAALGFEA